MTQEATNPARLVEHDPRWATKAAEWLDLVRRALAGVRGASYATYDHIGSTSVAGLAAKPFLDLQVRILPLPTQDELATRFGPVGFEQALGARPDSPGVTHDIPRGDETVPSEVWEKRLYVARAHSVVLHVRRSDSPWGRYTVWFRDWLRANPDARRRYEATKRQLSEKNVGKPDYDDYTRAKTAFFDEVQSEFTSWARRNFADPARWTS